MKKETNGTAADAAFEALLYQLLETELGGVQVYTAALESALNDELKKEWQNNLGETKRHVQIARDLLKAFGFEPDAELPARLPVRVIGQALVEAIKLGQQGTNSELAQLTAAECVVHAETKDHMNWELIASLGLKSAGVARQVLIDAYAQVEKEEDRHLYHTTGWARELWLKSFGVPVVLPPPEEVKQVETVIGAAPAKNSREEVLSV